MRAQHTLTVLARLPEQLRSLGALTDDLSALFDPRVLELFREIDSHAIDVIGLDPLGVLARLPEARLTQLAADAEPRPPADTTDANSAVANNTFIFEA